MSEIKLTAANFNSEVINADGPVLVDFWAAWCGPCQMLGPVISEIAKEYAGTIKVGKVNVDEEPALAEQFMIDAIPALLVFEKGKVKNQGVGFMSKEDVLRLCK